ncbi:MAG: LamG-like jellyroll fold domain-containing protein [Planctomycetota bacterium]|jgi:hypothetical protein
MNNKKDTTSRKGAALLIVLLVVMAITILSLGFLSRSDVELACGANMLLRTQMDYLAESGLEHARGLILNPQDVGSEYWTGVMGQQIVSGDDYYDIEITRDDSVPTDRCNYIIDCNSYRLKSGEKVGCSNLRARLRLDPCVALWSESDTVMVLSNVTVNGDAYCDGTLTNNGIVNGDVFANNLSGTIAGQLKAVGNLSLVWPNVTVADFTSNYPVQVIAASLSGVTLGPYDPVKVCYRGSGDVELASNVQIEGMLVVDGDLTIQGNGNVITAAKNLPGLLVTGDVIVEGGGELEVNGLVVVDGQMQINGSAVGVSILGGLFAKEGIVETTADSSGNGNTGTLCDEPTWQPAGGQIGGGVEFDGVDDKIEDADAGSYLNGLSAVTISLWVKSDVTNQDRGILFGRDLIGADEELGMRYDKDGAFGSGLKVIKVSIGTTSGYTQIESSSDVQTTGWQHLALVWASGLSLKLYIDGQLDLLTYDRGPVFGTVSGVEKLMLGRGAKGKYWDGRVDDVRIYTRVLDANEVSNIYQHIEVPSGLASHWELDEDRSSNNTITAAPTKTAIVVWNAGVAQKWGQAAGAFFRSIERR